MRRQRRKIYSLKIHADSWKIDYLQNSFINKIKYLGY